MLVGVRCLVVVLVRGSSLVVVVIIMRSTRLLLMMTWLALRIPKETFSGTKNQRRNPNNERCHHPHAHCEGRFCFLRIPHLVSGFKLPSLRTFVNSVSNIPSTAVAQEIGEDFHHRFRLVFSGLNQPLDEL